MIGVCWSVLFVAVVSTQNVSVPTALCQLGILNETLKVPIENITGQAMESVNIGSNQNSLLFEVQTCTDAQVFLMKENPLANNQQDQVVYEIIIGGCNNTMSAIGIKKKPDTQLEYHAFSWNHSVGPLNCSEMKSFCIAWNDTEIKVGYSLGNGFNEFMRQVVLSPKIKISSVATPREYNWVYNKTESSRCTVISVAENTTTPIGGTSATDTQTPAQSTGNTMTSVASATTVTTNIQQSTPTTETTKTIPPNSSICKCPCHLQYNQTEEERATYLRTAIEQIRKELIMEKKNLSSATRKKTSARDERVSAKTMGFTLGVCVLTTVFGSIIIVDLVKLGRFIWKRFL